MAKRQLLVLPAAFIAVHVTVVRPTGKSAPEGGVHVTRGEGSQVSIAVTVKLTDAEHWPIGAKSVTSSGHLIDGA